jgi:succinate dehydrogenase / fumarate reductase cytochrome b subunit
LWRNSIVLKALTAVTGVILALYVLVHLFGNLSIYAGPRTIDGYARFLHEGIPVVLWIVRVVLIVAFFVHVPVALTLWWRKRQARPIGYRHRKNVQASVASRTMIWTGLVILAFVIYHLCDQTWGLPDEAGPPG